MRRLINVCLNYIIPHWSCLLQNIWEIPIWQRIWYRMSFMISGNRGSIFRNFLLWNPGCIYQWETGVSIIWNMIRWRKKYLQLNGEAEADFFLSQIIEEEVYLALKQAIDILPPKIRTIFYLILERKTNAEIASLLGITEEAVKAYRKRGMKMLRIRLSNFWILALLIF